MERELGLLDARTARKSRTWRYRIEPPGRATLSQLVSRAEVEDTSGFDRSSLTIADDRSLLDSNVGGDEARSIGQRRGRPSPGRALRRSQRLGGVPVCHLESADASPCALAMTRESASEVPEQAFAIALTTLVAISAAGMLRDSLAERIPGHYGSLPILVACVIAMAGECVHKAAARDGGSRGHRRVVVRIRPRNARARTDAEPPQQARISRGPGAVWNARRPSSSTHASGHGRRNGRPETGGKLRVTFTTAPALMIDCSSRGSAPEMNFFSRRVFAGGETALLRIFRRPSQYEPSVVARLSSSRSRSCWSIRRARGIRTGVSRHRRVSRRAVSQGRTVQPG